MKNPIYFLFLLILSANMHAQVNTETLWAIWKDELAVDTSRLDAMNEICQLLAVNQPDSALILAGMMLDLAEDKNLKRSQVDAMIQQSHAYANLGEYVVGLNVSLQCLKRSEEMRYAYGNTRSCGLIGKMYALQGDYLSALDYYNQALIVAEDELNPLKGISSLGQFNTLTMTDHIHDLYDDIGWVYIKMNAYVKALEKFERNLIQYEKEGTRERMATNLNAIAFIYNTLGDDKNAQVYTKRSFEMAEEMENKPIMAAVLNNMGNIYMKQGDLQMAEEQFVSALKLGEEIGNKHLVGEGLYKLAQLSSEQGDNEKSLYYLDRASEIFEAIGTKDLSASSAIFRGGIFLEQGQYNQAADWCKNGLMLSEKLHSIEIERDACDCLYKTYKSLQQKSNALEYHERFLSLTDSLHLDHAGKRLQQMEFDGQMRTDSLVRAEELLDVQLVHDIDLGSKNRTRNVLIGSSILFLFLSGSLWSRLRLTRKSQARIQKEKDHSDDLLLHILPSEVVEEIKLDSQALARESDLVSVLFTEFNGFNVPSDKDNNEESADELHYYKDGFDAIIQKHGMKKIKSNDNSYVAAGGPPMEKDAAVINTVRAALEMQEFITKRKTEQSGFSLPLPDVRIGIHSGLVVAGIIGIKNYKQDIWGETVNIASLVEINGEVGHVNISQHTYDLIKNDSDFTFENRGKIHAKGKGEMEMYFVFNSVTKK